MPDQGPNRLEKTLALLFRPISKLLIKNEIPIQNAYEALKRSMVDVALDDGDVTDSHVSMKTGLHRKDVKRLRADNGDVSPKKETISPIAAVMTLWVQSAPFKGAAGLGRDLLRQGTGEIPGFDDLVRASKVDLPAATILTEMLRQELVAVLPDGQLRLLTNTYIPKTDDATLAAFDATVSDHVRIAVENTTAGPDGARYFDQVVRYSHLSQASVDALEAEARTRAAAYLEALNAMAHALQSKDDEDGTSHSGRFVSGVFVAPTPEASPSADTEEGS